MSTLTSDPLEQLTSSELVQRLASRSFAQSQAAAEVLFTRGAAALDALVEGLSHPDWRVRKQCAGLMDHLGDDRCVEPLRRALTDPIEGVRRLAIHALGCQPCKPAPLTVNIVGLLIERALSDPSIRVRRVAVHMLGLQPHAARVVETLQTIVDQETDPGLLSRARYALAEQRRKAEEGSESRCPVRCLAASPGMAGASQRRQSAGTGRARGGRARVERLRALRGEL
jgi:HEAT repeat protein